MEKDNKEVSIRFSLDLQDGGYYEARSDFNVFYSMGETQLEQIGRAFNSFLRQCTFYRPNEYIFMPSITEEEYEFLTDVLEQYRKDHSDGADEA